MSLTLTDVSFTFPGRAELITSVSLTLQPGESAALMAPSGTGKTTLLEIAGGLRRPDSGSVQFSGQVVGSTGVRVAWVRQSTDLLRRRSVEDNVALPLLAAGQAREAALRAAREELAQVGLRECWSRQVKDISGGEAQRTAIARAAVAPPDILLADEPTASLDRDNARLVATALVRRFPSAVVLIATHDPAVAQTAQRVLTLSDGQILGTA